MLPQRTASGLTPVLAVLGVAGAGKSTVARYMERQGYSLVYMGGFVVAEVRARGLPGGEESESFVRQDLRKQLGMAAMAKLAESRISENQDHDRPTVLDGLYSQAEAEYLRERFPLLTLAVHAPIWLRAERISNRPDRPLPPSILRKRDVSELGKLDKATPIALADAHIVNDGDESRLENRVAEAVEALCSHDFGELHEQQAR